MTGDSDAGASEPKVEVLRTGVAGLSVEGGDIRLPGVEGLGGVAGNGEDGLNGAGCGAVAGADGLKGDD